MDRHTRHHYLKAMGIPVWVPRGMLADTCLNEGEAAQDELDDEQYATLPATVTDTANTTHTTGTSAAPVSTARGLPDTVINLLDTAPLPRTTKAPSPVILPVDMDIPDCSQLGWQELQQAVSACQRCGLHKTRTQTVFGTGDQQARWMIIGEAPGAEEDRQGTPFVGRAGQLLNNMLAAIGLPREAVYIANTLKCRPPNNRDPKPEESALCRGYLDRQIALVNPALILVVGRIAAHNLLQVDKPLGQLRNTLHHLPGSQIPVIVTYHPAYLLRQPSEKRKAWQDLQMACRLMTERSGSETT